MGIEMNLITLSSDDKCNIEYSQLKRADINKLLTPDRLILERKDGKVITELVMQCGDRSVVSANGFLDIDILRFIKLRLEFIQGTDKACANNDRAIKALDTAINELYQR